MIPPEAFDYSECGEIADNMATSAPRFGTLFEAIRYVRQQMPDESVTVVDNVAASLWGKQIEALPVQPSYRLRFVTEAHGHELVNLYHLARTALSDRPYSEQSPYHRMLWACRTFHRSHPEVSEGAAYKDLCGLLDR